MAKNILSMTDSEVPYELNLSDLLSKISNQVVSLQTKTNMMDKVSLFFLKKENIIMCPFFFSNLTIRITIHHMAFHITHFKKKKKKKKKNIIFFFKLF
jgi:hypothetical protein